MSRNNRRVGGRLSASTDRNKAQGSQPEPVVRVEPLGAEEVEGNYPKRSVVRITSIRNRLLDPDNLVGGCKYIIDALTKAKVIKDDTQKDIRLEVYQAKCATRKEEKTIIEVE